MTVATAPAASHNRRVGLIAGGLALAMLGLGFASVPLYRLFCQATGLGGTTQRAEAAQAAAIKATAATISIRFDGNVERGMPWRFGPEQVTQTINIGARKMAYFSAENLSDKPITGQASFNVEPSVAGKYFTKIQCFCFTQQTLAAHQKVDMPVTYYVDPAILHDPDADGLQQITLSYTFHPLPDEGAKALDRARTAG